jgi:putative spermidine/putrescine transport system permease protein
MSLLRHRTPYLLCLPLVAFLGFYFLTPVGQMMALALTPSDTAGVFPDFTRFGALLGDSYYQSMTMRTLRIGFFTTLLSLILAYPVALLMRSLNSRWQSVLVLIMVSPLLTSVVVRTLAWVVLLSRRGVFNQVLTALGFSEVRFLYNEPAVIVALTHVFFGYMVISLLTILRRIDGALYDAAANLGASRLRMFIEITLPLSLPGVLAGSLLVFTLSASSYATPALVGGSRVGMLSMEIYNLAIQSLAWGDAAAVATILFFLIAGSMLVMTRIGEGGGRKVIFQ